MEMVAGSFSSEVRCGPFVLTYPQPFIFPAWTLPSWTHGACLNLPPLSLSCAGHELKALLGPNSLQEWLWASLRDEFALSYCCLIPLESGPGLSVCKVPPGFGLFLAYFWLCTIPSSQGPCKGLLQRCLGSSSMENTYSCSQNLCGRDRGQCLQWSRQNIPINGKKPSPSPERGGRGRLVFPNPF